MTPKPESWKQEKSIRNEALRMILRGKPPGQVIDWLMQMLGEEKREALNLAEQHFKDDRDIIVEQNNEINHLKVEISRLKAKNRAMNNKICSLRLIIRARKEARP